MQGFDSRSYSGTSLRPRPEVFIDEAQSLCIVATAWGSPEIAEQAIGIITDYFASAQDDLEVTSPFPLKTCLTATENYLRVAALLANEMIYRDVNQQEYHAGLELFALHFNPKECSFIQVGQPSCLLSRRGQGLVPIGVQMDLAMTVGSLTQGSPLPSNLLGLDPTANIEVKTFTPQPGDRIFLLCRSYLASKLFTLPDQDRTIDRITEVLAQDNENEPFWLGSFTFPIEGE